MPVSDAATPEDFLRHLVVESTGEDRFSARCAPAWPGRAFGGQLAAHSLQAAATTVPDTMRPWSLHIVFHAPVRSLEPVGYEVSRVKDGRSVSTRQVRVVQDDKLRATALMVFGAPGDGPQHQFHRPPTTAPEDLQPEEWVLDPTIVPADADFAALGYPAHPLFEVRVVPETASGARHAWIRVRPTIPHDELTSASTLCAMADLNLGTTALAPHGGRAQATDLQLGAIELALWFTSRADVNNWTLFAQDTPFGGDGHALAYGIFYNSDGNVSAVTLQNSLMRRS